MSQNHRRQLRNGKSYTQTSESENQSENAQPSPYRLSKKRKASKRALDDISNIHAETPTKVARFDEKDKNGNNTSDSELKEQSFNSFEEAQVLKQHGAASRQENLEFSEMDVFSSMDYLTEETTRSEFFEELNEINTAAGDEMEEEIKTNLLTMSDHIIIDIMSFLPVPSRLNMGLTCKRFNEILKLNPNRFSFTLKLDFIQDEIPEFDRMYRTVKILNLDTPAEDSQRLEKVIETFKTIGFHVQDVRFTKCKLSYKLMSAILAFMPNIKNLVIETTLLDPIDVCDWPELPSLKKVTVNGRNIESIAAILQHVTTLDEFIFVIPNSPHPQHDEDEDVSDEEENEPFNDNAESYGLKYDEIAKVMSHQQNLKALEIVSGNFFVNPFQVGDIQLKKLVLFVPRCSQNEIQNMRNFVLTQTQLESVVLNMLCMPNRYFNEIMDHLLKSTSVKDLRLVFYEESQMVEHFLFSNNRNPIVEDFYLGLQGIPQNNDEIIETATRMFPNLKKIHVNFDIEFVFHAHPNSFQPLSQLRRLEKLTVDRPMMQCLENISIPTLKEFTAGGILIPMTREDWDFFFNNNRTIEELRVQFSQHSVFNLSIVQFIDSAVAHLPGIKHIKICCRQELSRDDEETIKNLMLQRSSLKCITFCRFCVMDMGNHQIILRNNDGSLESFPREVNA